jgi:hypothetical protein
MVWNKALKRGFTMVIKVSRFDMLNNLEDFRATLDKMTMASQWKTEHNK